ncbi:MAG: ABC transporter substrate-binding protein [Clostridia bacterium]
MKKAICLVLVLVMAGSLMTGLAGCADKDTVTINVFNWGEYIDPDVLKMFRQETGIRVNYQTFNTNEDMYTKIASANSSYDVIFPSDYMIQRMREEGLLLPVDYSNVPNAEFVDEKFQNPSYDPGSMFSVPYMWGTVGILYNEEMVDDPVDSWAILWNEKYSQQILMQDSQRDSLMIALLKLGYSMNTVKEEEITAAKNELIRQKPLVLGYVLDEVLDKMVNGEAALAVVWSGVAVLAGWENESLKYVIPKEGSNVWVDAMAIPITSRNKKEAEIFINYMSRPEIAKMNAEYIGYSPALAKAVELLDEDWQNNEAAFPSAEDLARCEYFRYDKDAIALYNRAWTEIISE